VSLDGDAAPAALEAVALEKWFGPLPAVQGIDFRLESGQALTIFGPNGAGKTTLLRLLAGLVLPTRGEVRVLGSPIGATAPDDAWRGRIGVLSHQSFLYGGMSAAENLDFYARLYMLPDRAARVDRALDEVGLGERRADAVRTFSRGMQQRLALARTLLHEPEVVLLDEPYTGLDAHAAAMLRGVLGRLRDGRRTVVLVTHNLDEGLELADRVVVQVAGRWVSDEPVGGLGRDAFARLYRERVAAAL
jgi:heme exporter protein A